MIVTSDTRDKSKIKDRKKTSMHCCTDTPYQLRWAVWEPPIPSQPLRRSLLSSLWTSATRTNGLAAPTVYFQQLGFGLCTHRAKLPSLCTLSASSARCPPCQETADKHQAGGRGCWWRHRPAVCTDTTGAEAAGGLLRRAATIKTHQHDFDLKGPLNGYNDVTTFFHFLKKIIR